MLFDFDPKAVGRSHAMEPGRPVHTVEMHTAGEPVRIVVSGLPPIEGATLLEKRRFCRDQLDRYRRLLMAEPRGHRDMFGAILVPPDLPEADAAALFIHNEGYCTMCGHATLAVTRYLVDQGVVARAAEGDTAVTLQTPCGLVRARLAADNTASFHSVPAFVLHADLRLPLPDGGQCRLDISYGGCFYAVLRAADVGIAEGSPAAEYVRQADFIRRHLAAAGVKIHHPDGAELGFLFGVVFADFAPLSAAAAPLSAAAAPLSAAAAPLSIPAAPPPPQLVSQVVVFADGQLDRSPCGSGTSACCAVLHAAGRLPAEHDCTFRCAVTASEFRARVVTATESGGRPAVVVQVAGRPLYTGRGEYVAEQDDPFPDGFLVQ